MLAFFKIVSFVIFCAYRTSHKILVKPTLTESCDQNCKHSDSVITHNGKRQAASKCVLKENSRFIVVKQNKFITGP